MMLRIAESPDWDKLNEGKTLTPYWAAEMLQWPLGEFLKALKYRNDIREFSISGYKFEILRKHGNTTDL